jgi:thymidylate kinase
MRRSRQAGARRRGFTVALIGCDGAGKTTVARELERGSALPVRYLYMGVSAEASNRQLPTTRLANAVKRLRGTARPDHGPPEPAAARPAAAARPSARRSARAALRLANRLAEEWYRQVIAQAYQARGAIVVFDRHFLADYHAFDVTGGGRPLSRRVHGWMLSRAYPRPDLVVFLDAPPEVLHRRKGEGTLASLARRRADYLGLADAATLGGAFAVVSATQPLPDVVDEVTGLIRDHALAR